MSVGLDVGSYGLRSLYCRDGMLRGRKCRTAYAVLSGSPSHQSLLKQAQVPFAVCDDSIILFGDWAVDYAGLFRVPSLPLLSEGRLPTQDPLVRQVLAALTDALLPVPRREREVCCFAMPCSSADPVHDSSEEREFFPRLARLKGYETEIISAGLATVLAELSEEGFSGIGIVFGASGCEAVLAHRGMELMRCYVGRPGNKSTGRTQHSSEPSTRQSNVPPESSSPRPGSSGTPTAGSLSDPRNELDLAAAQSCRQLITKVAEEMAVRLEHPSLSTYRSTPLSVVCGGGLSATPGFRALAEETLRSLDLSFAIKSVRLAENCEFSAARGCLIRAELMAEGRPAYSPAA